MLVVKVGGKKGRDVVLPDLDPPRDVRPLVRFPVPANGVSGSSPRDTSGAVVFGQP